MGCANFAVFSVLGTRMSKYPILGYLAMFDYQSEHRADRVA